MTNALGDISTTQTLLAKQLGTKSNHITTAYIDNIIPPPVSAPNTLQEVCDASNTTNTDIGMTAGNLTLDAGDLEVTAGTVITDEVTAVAPNDVLTLKTYVKSLKVHYLLSGITVIPDDKVYGHIVQIRAGTGSTTITMPRWIKGGNFTLINSSGNNQRIVAAAGERLDGLPPPTFIAFTGTAPFSVECRAGLAGEWWMGQY